MNVQLSFSNSLGGGGLDIELDAAIYIQPEY